MGGLIAAYMARAKRTVEFTAVTVAIYAVVGILVISAYVAGMIGLGFYLAEQVGAVEGALLLAGGSLILALLLVLVVAIRQRIRERRLRLIERMTPSPATMVAGSLIPGLVRSSPVGSVVAMAAAAFVLTKIQQNQK